MQNKTRGERTQNTSPVSDFGMLYHVGDLETPRTDPYFSNEGRGVSISTHPDAWKTISRDVSGYTYRLTAPTETELYIAGTRDPRQVACEWCLENEYIADVELWRGAWEDSESGETRYILQQDRADAVREAEAAGGTGSWVEPVSGFVLADSGESYWESAFRAPVVNADPVQVSALIPVWYAEFGLGVSGVWWSEELAVSRWSAPRGVVFQNAFSDWEVRDVSDGCRQNNHRENQRI